MNFDYRKQRKKNVFLRIVFSKLFIVFCFIILAFSSIALGKEMIRKLRVNKEIDAFKQEITELDGENQELSQLIEYLKTENYFEKEARMKLGYQKQGEKVVVAPGLIKEDKSELFDASEIVNDDQSSNPAKWLSFFWGN